MEKENDKELERHEVWVISAVKGGFDKELGMPGDYGIAKQIIGRLVYGMQSFENVDKFSALAYLRGIILKTRFKDASIETYDEFIQQSLGDAQSEIWWEMEAGRVNQYAFVNALLKRMFGEIACLKIRERRSPKVEGEKDDDRNWETLIDLTISEAEREEIIRELKESA